MFQPSDSKLWAVTSGSSQISYEEKKPILVFVESYGVIMKDKKYMLCDCLNDGSSLSFLSNRYIFSFSIFYIMTSRAYIRLSLRLRQLKCCSMSPALDVFRCQ